MKSLATKRLRLLGWLSAGVILAALLAGGAFWIASRISDQLDFSGIPAATGTGPCNSRDSVNIVLEYADGHQVQACTRDEPSCRIQTTVTVNGQSQPAVPKFVFSNRLRSSSGHYILFIQSNKLLVPNAPDKIFQLQPDSFFPKGPGLTETVDPNTPPFAIVQIGPVTDPGRGFTAKGGTLSASSSRGEIHGAIDGTFPALTFRSDRPQPSLPVSPTTITGSFSCRT